MEWFFDWLQDVADDFRTHSGALRSTHFAVFGVGDSSYGAEYYNAVGETGFVMRVACWDRNSTGFRLQRHSRNA